MKDSAYHRNYSRNYYHARKNEIINRLGGKCVKCGSCDSLEIHHIDYKSKSYSITKKILSIPFKKLDEELSKCELLCKECHKKETLKQFHERSNGRGYVCKDGSIHPSCKACVCVTTGEELESVKQAARKCNCSASGISRVCNNLDKHVKGMKFVFKESWRSG